MTRYVASVMPPSRTPYQGWTPCIKWCDQYFDPKTWEFVSEGVFVFDREQDHLVFMLKWG